MQLTLKDDEVSAVLAALSFYLPQLREEIGKTENYEMRENLKAQEATLAGLITRLGGSPDDTGLGDIGASNPPWGV